MATTYKVLGQVVPTSGSLTTLYTVPAATSAVCSTLSVCNLSSSTYFRIAVRPAGAAIDPKHYVVYDAFIDQKQTTFLTLGLSLATTDVVSVYASHSSASFNLFGTEIA